MSYIKRPPGPHFLCRDPAHSLFIVINAAPPSLDRPHLLRFAADLVDDDTSIRGITLIEPDGSITYLDAGAIRRAGRA
jgi:hypothetical protein